MAAVVIMCFAVLLGILGALGLTAVGLMVGLYGEGSFAKLLPITMPSLLLLLCGGVLFGFGMEMRKEDKEK